MPLTSPSPSPSPSAAPVPPEPAWLKEAFSVEPLPPIAVLPTLSLPGGDCEGSSPSFSSSSSPAASPSDKDAFRNGMWGYVLPSTFFLGVLVLVVYIVPQLMHNWRVTEARGEAEAAYLKRRAELKAEAEHGDDMLAKLDPHMERLSLGFRSVVQKVSPLVVSVSNLVDRPNDHMARPVLVYDPIQDRRFWQMSVGSGFIARPGYILTNHHVVKDADQLRITFASGASVFVPRAAVASDDIMDLAVVRMPPNEDMNTALVFADSDKDVHVGDWSLTIGSPLGLKHTFTHGVISAKGRVTNWLPVELLQTDAAINPGNSGGPLLDQRGRVVGVNVALASENGRNGGIGFAIPSNAARKILDKLISEGRVPRGFLGVEPTELGDRFRELGKQDVGGALINKVLDGTPAFRAGLRRDDIVVRVNNEPLARTDAEKHLRRLIASIDPGTQATLEVLRAGQRLRINVQLGRRPD